MSTQQLQQLEDGIVEDHDASSDAEIAGQSPLRIAWRRLRRDPVAMISLIVVALFVLLALFAPLIAKSVGVTLDTPATCEVLECNATSGNYGLPLAGPPAHGFDADHPFGIAPKTGEDNLAHWLYGARNSLMIAFLAAAISTLIGITLGLIAGYAGGLVDRAINFVTDLFLSLPFLLAALCLSPILTDHFLTDPKGLAKAQFWGLVVILSVFGWMYLARLIRGEVLSLREREYVEAARQIGQPPWKILVRELLPNLVAPIVVAFSLGLPAYVTAEAGLSYLGIGLSGQPSWGQTINNATNYYKQYPLYLWEPVLGIAILVIALNLLGDAIRDALDPKTRR
ncbi:MAG TPA: ABC transporter permease [Marmoricola sp.]|nr:ABC transporter permease [Marmoricola sp.]